MTVDSLRVPQVASMQDLIAWLSSGRGTAVARLYTAPSVYLPTVVLGDFTEAAFVGYAPINPVVWGNVFINGGGKAESDSAPLQWTFTAGSGTVTVRGIYFTSALGTILGPVVPFLNPITLSPSIPSITRVVQLTMVGEL